MKSLVTIGTGDAYFPPLDLTLDGCLAETITATAEKCRKCGHRFRDGLYMLVKKTVDEGHEQKAVCEAVLVTQRPSEEMICSFLSRPYAQVMESKTLQLPTIITMHQ